MVNSLKNLLARLLRKYGYEIQRKKQPPKSIEKPKLTFSFDYLPSTENRPIGDINTFLHDIRKRGFECRYVYDVGANKTEYSAMVKKIFPAADFLLFEPIVEMESYLSEFCLKNPGSEYILKGVGSVNRKMTITLEGDSFEGSTFMLHDIPSFKKAKRQREVDVITIDSILEKGDEMIPDLVKIDVQGFELEVLKGAKKLLGKTELFIIEISLFKFNELTPEVAEIFSFLADNGYVIYDIAGFLRRPYDGALAQLDVCFIHKDSFLKETIRWKKA